MKSNNITNKSFTEFAKSNGMSVLEAAKHLLENNGNIEGYVRGGAVVDPKKEQAKTDAKKKVFVAPKLNQKHELLNKGVNVDLLAPESEEKAQPMKNYIQVPKVVGFAKGGPVKGTSVNGYTFDGKSWLDKNGNKLTSEAGKKYTEAYNKSIEKSKSNETQKKSSEIGVYKRKLEEAKSSGNNTEASKLQAKINELTGVKEEVKASEVNSTAKPATKQSIKAPKVASKSSYTPPSAEPKPEDEIIVPVKETVVEDTVSADNAKKLADSAFAADATNNPALKTNPKQKKGIADYLGNIDPTSLVGPAQTIMGFNSLRDEKRPIDDSKLDPIYNQSVNRAIKDAEYGLTAENKFLMNEAQNNAINDSRYSARNFAGGNAGTAFNQERQAINSGLAAKLGLRVADQDLRMQKQQYADAQIANRAQIEDARRRRQFSDAMGAYQQKQEAGSELIGAGLANTIGAYRYNKELTEQKRRNDLDWSRNYGK
jgi:hypothetical protein